MEDKELNREITREILLSAGALVICSIATGKIANVDAALASLGGYNEAREVNDKTILSKTS